MKDLLLLTPRVGDRISSRYLSRLERVASNVPSLDAGIVGATLSAIAPNEPPPEGIVPATLTGNLTSGGSTTATFLVGADRDETGSSFTVHDKPAFIASGKQIVSGSKINVAYDSVQKRWRMITPDVCETAVA